MTEFSILLSSYILKLCHNNTLFKLNYLRHIKAQSVDIGTDESTAKVATNPD